MQSLDDHKIQTMLGIENREEGGTVTLSTLQPQVGFPVTATLADPDNVTAGSVSWQWYNDTIDAGGLIEDATSATYTPTTDDVGTTLMARASYTDGSPNADDAKDFAMMAAAHSVLADTRNKAPVFADQDAEMEGRQDGPEAGR